MSLTGGVPTDRQRAAAVSITGNIVMKDCARPPWVDAIYQELDEQQHPSRSDCMTSTAFALAGESTSWRDLPGTLSPEGISEIPADEGWGSVMLLLANALLAASSSALSPRRTLVVNATTFAYGGVGRAGAAGHCTGARALECLLRPISSCSIEDVVSAAQDDGTLFADGDHMSVGDIFNRKRHARYLHRHYLRTDPDPSASESRYGCAPSECHVLPSPLRLHTHGYSPWERLSAHRAYLHELLSDAAREEVSAAMRSVGETPLPQHCMEPLVGVHIRLGDHMTSVSSADDGGPLRDLVRPYARVAARAAVSVSGRRFLIATDAEDMRAVENIFEGAVLEELSAIGSIPPGGPGCVLGVPRRFAVPKDSGVASFLAGNSSADKCSSRWDAAIDALVVVEALSRASALVGSRGSSLTAWTASVAAARGCVAEATATTSAAALWVAGGHVRDEGPVLGAALVRDRWLGQDLEWDEGS